MTADVPSIPADGSAQAIVTAIARDASNRLLADVSVDFSATSGGIAGSPAITNEFGEASVMLTTAGDATSRVITVTGTTTKNGLTHSVNVTVQ
ncbi:Ig-like domain-containing protein [Povalibacter sp.]|uniref:Ig-like domain-containing protein n=1 Tax=Povalibacter sp. TaxID=1962978 RepID=UPI002F3FB6F3